MKSGTTIYYVDSLTLTGTAKAGPRGPPTRRLAKFR